MKKYLIIIIGAFLLSCCASKKIAQQREAQKSHLDFHQNDSAGMIRQDCLALKKIDFSTFSFSDFNFQRFIEEEIDAGESIMIKRRIIETGSDKSKMMQDATARETIQQSASLATNVSAVHAGADEESASSHSVFKQSKGAQWCLYGLAIIVLAGLALWKRTWIANNFFKK